MHLYFDDLGRKDYFQDASQSTQITQFCEHFEELPMLTTKKSVEDKASDK